MWLSRPGTELGAFPHGGGLVGKSLPWQVVVCGVVGEEVCPVEFMR